MLTQFHLRRRGERKTDKPLRVLHLEDDPDFAELVKALLQQDDLEAEVERVTSRAEFESSLRDGRFDIILSDFHLPHFTGLEALAFVRRELPGVPFILISGTIGERAAIDSLKAGATDYVLKQNPERLASAVRRAVQETAERAKRQRMEMELVRHEKYFRTLTEHSLDILCVLSREGRFLYISPSVERVLGLTPVELQGTDAFGRAHPEDLLSMRNALREAVEHPDRTVKIQFRYQKKDGTWTHLELIGQNRLNDPDAGGLVTNWRDVSDRRRVEEELRRSEEQYRLLFQDNPNPMWVFDFETLAFLEVNEKAVQYYGYSREEFLAMKMSDLCQAGNGAHWKGASAHITPQAFGAGNGENGRIWKHRRRDGAFIDVEMVWSPMAFRNHFAALTMVTNVTERRRDEHRNRVFSRLSHRLSSAISAAEAATIICEASDALFSWSDFALDLYVAERDEVFSLLNITTVDEQRVKIPVSARSEGGSDLIRRVVAKGAELVHTPGAKGHALDTMMAPVRSARGVSYAQATGAPTGTAPRAKGNRAIGVLFVQSHIAGAYREGDLETLQMLADQCGGALERVRAEEALRESQKRFRDLFENSPDAILVVGLEGGVLDVNLAGCLLHGLPREGLLGKNVVENLVPAGRREEARRDLERMASGKWSRVESEALTVEGRAAPVEIRASRVEYGEQPALLLHVRDITERREAQAALQSSEALFRSVWKNSMMGLRLVNEEGLMVAVNDAFCRLVGMEAQQLEGQPFTVIYAASSPGAQGPDLEKMLAEHGEAFRAGVERRVAGAGEPGATRTGGGTAPARRRPVTHPARQYVLQNGTAVTLETIDSFIQLGERPPLMLTLFRDVTAQRQLEEQLRQAQKMEAIGQLAGGVAHDFNNILTVIQGHASLLLAAQLSETAGRSAEQIFQAADRAAGLTRQLLTFSRRQVFQPKPLDLNKVVGNLTNMLGRLLGEDVALQLNYCPVPPVLEADAGMLEQVLLNLAVNARDAMPKGGQLAIRIAVEEVSEAYSRGRPDARAGRFVCLSVADTGAGIAPEHLPRVFEPFFTTKEIGKGTGLGLATAYGIVKQHQGWIEVESQLEKGTTFRIYLPYTGSGRSASEKPNTRITVRGGNETILVVEDEAPVCELVSRLLSRHGYHILSAGNAVEALEVWRNHKEQIALLLTDLVMPNHMNGRELAEKLWTERPNLKVIFTSGYSADIVGKDFKLEPELNFLQKPYHPQVLAATVRRCLDGKQN